MIYLSNDNSKPLYLQIYEAIRQNILNGAMPKNTALQPIRILANELNVSKNTVEHAYQQLLEEGMIRAVKGSGHYVEDLVKIRLTTKKKRSSSEKTSDPPVTLPERQNTIRYDFRYSICDTHLFPWSKWKQYVTNAILDEATVQFSRYESNKGYYPLRVSLCEFLQRTRGVKCSPEQIIICAGTQYGLETILSLISSSHKCVAFEEPGFIGMRRIFQNHQFEIKPVTIQEEGCEVTGKTQKRCKRLEKA